MTAEDGQRPITKEYPVLVGLQGPLEGRRWKDGNVYLEDLGSKNGTFFGGEQLTEEIRLSDGDTIQIALIQKFAFYSSDATMPIEDLDPRLLKGYGRLQLEEKSRRVWVKGKELVPPLSAAQFRLLQCLYEQSGKVVPRDVLISQTWGEEESAGVSDQALDALIRRLRDRLQELDDSHQYIVTVRGHGTRLDNPIA